MNTLGHAVFNLAVLDRGKRRWPSLPIVAGALLPDIPIFLFYFYQKVNGVAERVIWGDLYFRREWQDVFNTFHSIPIALAGFLIAYRFKNVWLKALFASACMHSIIDLPLHNDDAHAHFFPFTDYRFASPVSYWDPSHYGMAATVGEALLVLSLSFWLWRKIEARWGKGLLLAVNFLYILGALLYFTYMTG